MFLELSTNNRDFNNSAVFSTEDITLHLSEWLKSKALTTQDADKNAEHELSFLPGGSANWFSHLGRQV